MTRINTIEQHRRSWNRQQSLLRRALLEPGAHARAIELFLSQHALLHSARMARTTSWSFEDAILNDLSDEQVRRIPRAGLHSLAWDIWHIARIEDTSMNLLVAGSPQVLHRGHWLERLKISARDTGNAMDAGAVAALSAAIDISALRAYRVAVGRRTRAIVQSIAPEDLTKKVDPARLERVMLEGALVEQARDIYDFWARRTIAGLLLMPATRHSFVHLNEALRRNA